MKFLLLWKSLFDFLFYLCIFKSGNLPVNMAKDGNNDKDVKAALQVIEDNFSSRNQQDAIVDAIQSLLNEAFLIVDPKGTKRLSSQRLYQALWRTASRMKPLDFLIHGDSMGRDFDIHRIAEKIVTGGVATIMDKGGYDSALRDKNGAFFNLLLYGDGLIQIGTGDDDIPIAFSAIASKNVYTDNYATGIRMAGKGRSAQKMVIIFSYSMDEYLRLYPDMKGKVEAGRIDRIPSMKDQQRTFNQEFSLDNLIEEAHSYDLTTKTNTIFAGGKHTIREKYKGENYPFIMEGSPYIPILQFLCIPSSDGFWNYGIGHLLYRLAIVSRQLMNLEVNHISDNVLPIELISLPQGQAANFFNRLKAANKMRAAGQKGYVPMERSANDPNGSAITSQTLTTQNLFDEWQAVYDRLDQEIRRCGINIDELDVGGTKTATEILALEENANSFVKQIMEWNASETQEAVEITVDMIKEFIPDKNDYPVNLTTKIDNSRMEGVTMGMVAEELRSRNYFVEVNARTGAIPSNIVMRQRYGDALMLAQPGSPAQMKIITELNALNGIDIPGEEFIMQMSAPSQGAGPEIPGGQVSGTERASIRPNQPLQPAI